MLDQEALESLGIAWESWARAEGSAARLVSRARLHLFFLLARYGGLRASEIAALKPVQAIDSETGLLDLPSRRLFLPPAAMRTIRRIISLPEAARNGFLQIDPGFLRKTFYTVAQMAGLSPASCAPRALRQSRALELLNMRMPPQLVAKMLGMRNMRQLASLLKLLENVQANRAAQRENILPGLVKRVEIGPQCARVSFEIGQNTTLYCLCGLERVLEVEPASGQFARFHIPFAAFYPRQFPHCAHNGLDCRILELEEDPLEIRLKLEAANSISLHATLDSAWPGGHDLKRGEKIAVNISAHMIRMESMN